MMSDEDEYAVVRFVEKEHPAFAVIHESWKASVDGVLHCWCPKTCANAKAKDKKPPKYDWSLYKVEIKCSADEWSVAYNNMLQIAETSGSLSSVSRDAAEQPKRKRPHNKTNGQDGASPAKKKCNQSMQKQGTAMPRLRSSHDDGNASLPSLSEESVQHDPNIECRSQSQEATPGTAPRTSSPAKHDKSSSSAVHICHCTCSLFKDMKLQLNEIRLLLNQFLNPMQEQGHINNDSERHHSSGSILLEDIIEDPCETISQLQHLEKELNDSDCKKSDLVSALKGVAGAQLPQTVRNIMTRIAMNKVWKFYSLKGQKSKNGQKMSFHNLTLYKTIRRACRLAHPGIEHPDQKIKDHVARYLTVIGSRKDDDKEECESKPVIIRALE